MYNELKKHWDGQFRLSANKILAEFRRNLEHGGKQARVFIGDNMYLAETAFGSPEDITAVIDVINKDREAAENQAYFFTQAIDQLGSVRTLFARKFEASVRYCEQEGIPVENFTPETLLPCVRKAEEEGGFGESKETNTPDVIEEAASISEDDLKAKINILVGDGASKTEIWREVAEDAKSLGWNNRRVWAYVDEITL